MVSQKYRGSCIGAALTKWLTKNTIINQKMALKKKMEDGALEMLFGKRSRTEIIIIKEELQVFRRRESALEMKTGALILNQSSLVEWSFGKQRKGKKNRR